MKIFAVISLLLVFACGEKKVQENQEQASQHISKEKVEKDTASSKQLDTSFLSPQSFRVNDTLITLLYNGHSIQVEIDVPEEGENLNRTALLLHGWNLAPNEWCKKTDMCLALLDSGYTLIKPNFGKTTYHWELYPETIEPYRAYPSRKWMYETFLPYLQDSLDLLKEDNGNVVLGLSTGGRVAALWALEHPEIFKACVALSADFDHSKLVDEPINNGFYGPLASFPERWEGRDNIYNRAEEWAVPIYLGHAQQDKMCPVSQTTDFANSLKVLGFEEVQLSTPENMGHNYAYWSSETKAIMQFVSKY